MTYIFDEINKEIYLAVASTITGIMVTKIFDFFYPDAIKIYATALCVQKPKELRATDKLSQIFEEDIDGSGPPLGYKNYKYGVTDDYDWRISITENEVNRQARIYIYTTLSTKPESGYHYFYYKIRYNNTDNPKVNAFCKKFNYGNFTNPVLPFDNTSKYDTHCLENNIITGSHCFASKINDTLHGNEIGTEQIGLTFGDGSGEYIIEEAYISDKQINIKKCWCTYIFWRCYNRKPKYVNNP